MRVFFALPIPCRHQKMCRELSRSLEKDIPGLKGVAEGNFHITLKFLGHIDPEMIPAVTRQAERAFRPIQPVTLILKGLGAFPPRGKPRVIWVGVEEEGDQLPVLARNLDQSLIELGIPGEGRVFTPHLTVARLKPAAAALKETILARPFSAAAFQVSRIILYRSILKPEGPQYSVLKNFLLS